MITKRAHNKTYTLLTMALSILLCVMMFSKAHAFSFEEKLRTLFTHDKKPEIFASLSGFQPDAKVNYKIIANNGTIYKGNAQIDENGNLAIKMPEGYENLTQEIKYNFIIDETNQRLNLILKHNPFNNTLAMEGSGTSGFTKITVESDEDVMETHSDWAGIFKETNINKIFSTKEDNSYKVAFFNTNVAQGVESLRAPSTIKIQYAPGGGGASDSDVNQYETTNCGADVDISYCSTSDMDNQFQRFVEEIVEPMQMMAEQLTVNAYQQAFIIGTFFDAKEQLDTQRDMRALVAEAHRDYQPSEQLCHFGSFTRDLAQTEEKVKHNKTTLNEISMAYFTNEHRGSSAYYGEGTSIAARMRQFRQTYCNPADLDGGLIYLCEHDRDNNFSNSAPRQQWPTGIGAEQQVRINKDIDYARTIDSKLTLNIDFTDSENGPTISGTPQQLSADEEDIIALAKNLYWPVPMNNVNPLVFKGSKFGYMNVRRYTALRNIAHNSYAHQVAIKARADTPDPSETDVTPGWAYIKTMMREFGVTDTDIEAMIGEHPSYYAQMDFLTKKLYQHPDFYTNLYDKEANVERILAALEAISLMQQRDHHQTMLRQEMLTSSLLQTSLIPEIERLQAD